MGIKIKKKPGLLIYSQDMRPAVRELSDEDIGKLVRAMLEYDESRKLPDFQTEGLRVSWAYFRAIADRDEARYALKSLRGKYGSDKKKEMRVGVAEEDIMPFEEWLEINDPAKARWLIPYMRDPDDPL